MSYPLDSDFKYENVPDMTVYFSKGGLRSYALHDPVTGTEFVAPSASEAWKAYEAHCQRKRRVSRPKIAELPQSAQARLLQLSRRGRKGYFPKARGYGPYK